MDRFVGHNRGRIRWVSSELGYDGAFGEDSVIVPPELSSISSKELLASYKVKGGTIVKKADFSDTSKLKAAFISVWGIQCGIATYSQWLWPELGKQFLDWRVFAECAAGVDNYAEHRVTRCWKRGEAMEVLLRELERFGPDVVYIQHEWGIFPDARYWLAFLSAIQARYRVIVTFHSVYPEHPDKAICLTAAQEIIVHTKSAYECEYLRGSRRYLVPHGALPNEHAPRPFNMLRTEHSIVQFGFGFRYKGWHVALEVVHWLREQFRDVFFTGLYSLPANAGDDVQQYYDELQDQIDRLELRNNVALIKGFQSEESLKNHLRMSRVALFPYIENGKHKVYGCSGAARFTMSQGVAIATSKVPLFEDLGGVVTQGETIPQMAECVRGLFQSAQRKKALERQDAFLEANSWAKAGERYAAVLSSQG